MLALVLSRIFSRRETYSTNVVSELMYSTHIDCLQKCLSQKGFLCPLREYVHLMVLNMLLYSLIFINPLLGAVDVETLGEVFFGLCCVLFLDDVFFTVFLDDFLDTFLDPAIYIRINNLIKLQYLLTFVGFLSFMREFWMLLLLLTPCSLS